MEKTIGPTEFDDLLAHHDPKRKDKLLTILDANLGGISLADRDLSCCVLVRCRLVDVSLERCSLLQSELIDSTFERCRLRGCNLRKADLRSADLRGVDFTGSDMTVCDLTDADLRGADLTDCALDWAWLIQCDMRDAVLKGTSFRGARISESKLYNSHRFGLGPHNDAKVVDVDLSPEGDRTIIVNGDELWSRLNM